MAYKIGDKAHGGIVFSVDGSGEHGLVAAEMDQSTGANWNDAKKICSELDLGGFNDWFLPSKDQLDLMYTNLHEKDTGGFSADWYWSSTGGDGFSAWLQSFANGNQVDFNKVFGRHVRAARAF